MRPGLAVLLGFSLTMEEFKQEKQFLPFAEIACSCYQKYLWYSLKLCFIYVVTDGSQDIKANISKHKTPSFQAESKNPSTFPRNFLGIANIYSCTYLFEHLISKWVEMVQCVSRKTLKLISWCNVMSRSGHECKNILSVGRLLIDIDCLLCLSSNYSPYKL